MPRKTKEGFEDFGRLVERAAEWMEKMVRKGVGKEVGEGVREGVGEGAIERVVSLRSIVVQKHQGSYVVVAICLHVFFL